MQKASSAGVHRDAHGRLRSAVLADPRMPAGRKRLTLALSALLHTLLVAAVVILPLAFHEVVAPRDMLGAFLVSPLEVPPPPPPPSRGNGLRAGRVPSRIQAQPPNGFVAPRDVPSQITAEPAIEPDGGNGDPNGVDGGVPDGAVGAIVGGLPPKAPPPPPKVVRVGGQIVAPARVRYVQPSYPQLAVASHVSAIIILEAQVDFRGIVKTASVLRGHPLFDDAAVEAVKQWRYKPLLLNGEATDFILTVTVAFNLTRAGG
jgi:protein TonB